GRGHRTGRKGWGRQPAGGAQQERAKARPRSGMLFGPGGGGRGRPGSERTRRAWAPSPPRRPTIQELARGGTTCAALVQRGLPPREAAAAKGPRTERGGVKKARKLPVKAGGPPFRGEPRPSDILPQCPCSSAVTSVTLAGASGPHRGTTSRDS